MEKLYIAKTEDTPEIDFSPDAKEMKISGRSLPEDVTTFYAPVMDWLDQLEETPGGEYKLIVNLEYFNTASSKLILDILMRLEDIHTGGSNTIEIVWNYDKRDTDMEEAAEEYSELVEVPFTIVGI
ncbi:MAG: DUF1987 domain-containing protein [Cryomorphaceae bacterium]|jgi:hypothetical protein|nr:DUF1987 domain-containing protein [Cryomorphaceae bacterium]